MKRLSITLLICLFISCYYSTSQTLQSVDKWVEYLEELSEDTENEEQVEALYTDLSYLTEHPLDLNTASAEMFRRLPFLSDTQIEAILAYRKRFGNMATVYELKNIEALDWPVIELLTPFVFAGETVTRRPLTSRNLLKYGSNEWVVRYDRSLQEKQGYQPQPDSILQKYPNRKYLGEPFYHSMRYSYTFDERLQAGFVAEKDAGEPFLNRYHKGYDYYSAHVLVRDMGWLKTLAVGDYKVSFGQGLVISHDYTPGRNAFLTQAERRSNGFRRHYSTNETDFFRGAASTVRWKELDISLFYSSRKSDATVEDANITSFKTDGLHRLPGDRDKMRVVTVQTYGGNIRYATPQVVIGMTALTCQFGNLSVEPDPEPYNRFYFRGTQYTNASVDYLYKNKQVKLYGETAVSKNGAWATLNALQWTPASYASGLILYRSYARDYQAYYGNAFSQNSAVQNEQGLYLGMQLTPVAHWKFSGYADFFRFPWLKYEVDAPSSGVEYMAQADYSQRDRFSMYLRYRYRQKESNRRPENQSEVLVLPYDQHRIRWQITYNLLAELLLRTSADASIYLEEQGRESRGWMVSQSAAWKCTRIPLQADLYLAWYQTDDYYSRLSSYEKKLLYVYSAPFLYGKGTRLSAVFRYPLMKKLSVSAKIGWTHYLEGETVGSGLETVNGPNRTDVNLMLQWKF
ncbi:MAG: helix-hairpin-helix domain-containing protein [Tannerella sp.]|jgi:hypothetical protein|nr:helix-hairpin-helix domain-containing protein [Tannerella sp.]